MSAGRFFGPAKALYDGSWTGWGGRDDTEVAKGPADALKTPTT